MNGDADIAAIASAIGDPARALMLSSLFGGRALPASELASAARVAPSTASEHLARLVGAGLITVERHGRHRYHRLASERVAEAIEALAVLAPELPVRSLHASDQATAERAARSCYDHLAGTVGVALADGLCAVGALEPGSLGLRDERPFQALGVDIDAIAPGRRPVTRACLDWSERRHHLAGALGAAVLSSLLQRGWLVRAGQGRAVTVTPDGQEGLAAAVGLDVGALAPTALGRAGSPAKVRRRPELVG
jgi:DNA-binding transcriptional ArsR family regulator